MSTPTAVAVSVFLLVANGFFVWAEFALVAARRTRMEALVTAGSRRAGAVLRAMDDLNFVLAGAQLGITMASLGLGFVAEPLAERLLADPLHSLPESVANAVEITIALTVVVAAHMVIGEMLPKNLAIAEPDASALWVAFPFRLYSLVFGPVIGFVNAIANGIVRLAGVPVGLEVTTHTAGEIAALLEVSGAEGAIDPFEQRLLSRIIRLRDLDAGAAMVPRREVVALPATATSADVSRVVVESGHSRIPVYGASLDDVAGFVHVKDLLGVPAAEWEDPIPRSLIRDALVVPESRALLDVLTDMRSSRTHVAVVVDEHGGVEGLLTLEDILEELVGDIRDEYDRREGTLWQVGSHGLLADGRLRVDELGDNAGLRLPEGDYDTLGGYVMATLGRVPVRGDEVEHGGWRMRVRRMDGRRVDLVELRKPEDTREAGEDSYHDDERP